MDTLQIYGQLDSEKLAEDNLLARKIVKEINGFEISERQRWLIINQLAMELENVEDMKALTSFVKERAGSTIFISRIFGTEEEKEEV